jgi:ABC-2 type transport system permease protein
MTQLVAVARRRVAVGRAEARKLPAFVRRDLLVALSYRAAFASDLLQLAVQAVLFSFIGKLIDPAVLPAYGGTRVTYLEFAMIGVALSVLTGLLLQRVAMAIRQEQLIGTLEAVLATPTAPATVQAGSVAFDLIFVPVRMGALLLVVALAFGLDLHPNGILPSLVVLIAYVPFVWGLGLLSAAAVVTFRRGGGALGAGVGLLGVASGAFFPLALLPGWLHVLAQANPLAITIETLRETLIGGEGWTGVPTTAALLLLPSAASLALGLTAFRAALAREQHRGTLGLY